MVPEASRRSHEWWPSANPGGNSIKALLLRMKREGKSQIGNIFKVEDIFVSCESQRRNLQVREVNPQWKPWPRCTLESEHTYDVTDSFSKLTLKSQPCARSWNYGREQNRNKVFMFWLEKWENRKIFVLIYNITLCRHPTILWFYLILCIITFYKLRNTLHAFKYFSEYVWLFILSLFIKIFFYKTVVWNL